MTLSMKVISRENPSKAGGIQFSKFDKHGDVSFGIGEPLQE